MKCECPYTLKVPLGNAFQVLFPVKTAEWKDGERTVEVADVRALTDVAVFVDGDEWEQGWEMDERGPLVNFPQDSLAKGPHNVEITADYFGVAIRAAYFECITMVQWSYESNIGNYIIGSPLVAEAAYIYVGITDDAELEALKQQYREATAACETARLAYEAAKEAMSGFTTTGSSILSDIESLPKSLLFWRSLTHWIGGRSDAADHSSGGGASGGTVCQHFRKTLYHHRGACPPRS